jgi:polysaccharide biosynthesis protein PslH
MRKRALFLTPEAPYPLTGGGAYRTASLLEYLARRYAVDVIVFREPGAQNPAKLLPEGLAADVHVVNLERHGRHPAVRWARNVGRLGRGAPPLIDRFSGYGAEIEGFLRGRHYDVAVAEHFWCAPYADLLATASASTVLDLHNVESVWHESCGDASGGTAALAHSAFAQACRELERQWLPRFGLLLAASEDDRRRLLRIVPGAAVVVYPNALPRTEPAPFQREEAIIFSGNMEYQPNLTAIRYFHKEIWPLLRSGWPELRWRVLGKNEARARRMLQGDERIQVTGPIANPLEEIGRAKAAVVPLLSGSGTRVKILEAWAAGTPVVSTPLGAEGLPSRDGENILLAAKPAAFADALSRLLASNTLRENIAGAGRREFERNFTWEAAWLGLNACGAFASV